MIERYKKISEEILEMLSFEDANENELEAKLDERQELLSSLNENQLKHLKEAYHEKAIFKLDEEIKGKLSEKISIVKKELREYRDKKAVNFAYANMNKNNLNIFSTKV